MNKFNAVRTGGYASKKERSRAAVLHAMQNAGVITDLREQVSYTLIDAQYINGKCVERPVFYVADFVYKHGGKTVVEDVKGCKKGNSYALFVIKRKLMLKIHGIRVVEI